MLNELQTISAARTESELVSRLADKEETAVTSLMQSNNQRLFRVAWSILKDRSEAEDTVQSAYLGALRSIGNFRGASSLSTWLTRITINEALMRRRSARVRWARLKGVPAAAAEYYRETMMRGSASLGHPDARLVRAEIRKHVEKALARLPEKFRVVFILREVEGMSVREVAQLLALEAATVKTRNLRAKERLRKALGPDFRDLLDEPLPFAEQDCAALTRRVIELFLGT